MTHSAHSLSLSLVTMVQVYPEESISAVAEMIAVESKKEVVIEDIVMQEEERKPPMQFISEPKISQPVRARDDDWFLLLDVVPRETTYVPPGTHGLQMSFHTSCTKEDSQAVSRHELWRMSTPIFQSLPFTYEECRIRLSGSDAFTTIGKCLSHPVFPI